MDELQDVDAEVVPRTAQEVAERALAIIATIGKVHFPEPNAKWVADENISRFLTPTEAQFIGSAEPSDQERIDYSWKAEALASLIWSLHGLEHMPPFDEQFSPFDNDLVLCAIRNTETFLNDARIRTGEEVDAMEAFLYHQHWRVRDHEFGFGMDKPGADDPDISELHPGIVYERRYGMSWVAGFGESWDDVPTDT